MLQSLRVKNLALMKESEIEFGSGLNILTGETGAGKSLLLDSINLALGGKFEKDMLRNGEESAQVELLFADCSHVRDKLIEMELDPSEDDSILITRKMQVGRSVFRINGETVSAKQVKLLAEELIDIHGQHEHQSLLKKSKHMEILDAFCGGRIESSLKEVVEYYQKVNALSKKIEEEAMDEASRKREQALAEFEYQEIQEANLVPGEDNELETRYRFMINSKKISENLTECFYLTGTENDDCAGSALARAARSIGQISSLDEKLIELKDQLLEIDSLLADLNLDISAYLKDCSFEEEEFHEVEERLNTINRLKGKYGKSIEEVLAYAEERKAQLEKYADFDTYMIGLEKEKEAATKALEKACETLSGIRREEAKALSVKLKDALTQLNFLTVDFEIQVNELDHFTRQGKDDVEFMISVNPGETKKPLGQVSSGGELSRIMLAIKTVLAKKDKIDTLIFDEIDAGISGVTAWKVSEQLHMLACAHQVICITHLPQIAAMSDCHFLIKKSTNSQSTETQVKGIGAQDSLGEIARLLGSDELTEAALLNAEELKNRAVAFKKECNC